MSMPPFDLNQNWHDAHVNIDSDNTRYLTEDSFAGPDRNQHSQISPSYLAPDLPLILSALGNSNSLGYSLGYSPLVSSLADSFRAAPQASTQDESTDWYSVAGSAVAGTLLPQSQQWQQTENVNPGFPHVPESSHVEFEDRARIKTQLQSLSELTQSILPQLDENSLLELRISLQHTFSRLETLIQTRFHQIAPIPPTNPDVYRCKLCRNSVEDYQKLGTFKRHVTAKHRPEYIYRCSEPLCTFDNAARRDKFREHLQHKHDKTKIENDLLNACRKICPSPVSCDICHVGVSNWKEWFKCVANHCRLPNGASTTTDISRSSRGSGSSGEGGSDSGGPQSGGGGFNGASPSFEDNQMSGRENDYKNIGDQFNPYQVSYTQYTAQAQPGYESLHSIDLLADSLCDSQSYPASATKDSESPPVDFDSTNVYNNRLALASTLKDHSASGKSHTLILQQKGLMQKSDSSSRLDIKHIKLGSSGRNFQNDLSRYLEWSFKRQCKSCEHVLEGCTQCKSSGGAARRCHVCAGRIRQQIPLHGTLHGFLHDNEYQNQVCNLEPKIFPSSKKSVVKMSRGLRTHSFAMSLCGNGYQFDLCTSEILSRNESTYILSFTSPGRKRLFFTIFRRSNDGHVSILTDSLPDHIYCPPNTYTNAQDTMTILGLLEKFELSVFPTMLMSRKSSRFYRSLLENLAFPLMSFLEKEEWSLSSLSRNVAILKVVQEGSPYFKAEIHMQLLEGSPDSTSPDFAETTSHLRKRSRMLQTRLRVIVKLFKLKTKVMNAQNAQVETERAKVYFSASSDVILNHPESSEIVFEVPISETKESPTTWDLIQSTAIYFKDVTISVHKRYHLEEHDDFQLGAASLTEILPKLLDNWIETLWYFAK